MKQLIFKRYSSLDDVPDSINKREKAMFYTIDILGGTFRTRIIWNTLKSWRGANNFSWAKINALFLFFLKWNSHSHSLSVSVSASFFVCHVILSISFFSNIVTIVTFLLFLRSFPLIHSRVFFNLFILLFLYYIYKSRSVDTFKKISLHFEFYNVWLSKSY